MSTNLLPSKSQLTQYLRSRSAPHQVRANETWEWQVFLTSYGPITATYAGAERQFSGLSIRNHQRIAASTATSSPLASWFGRGMLVRLAVNGEGCVVFPAHLPGAPDSPSMTVSMMSVKGVPQNHPCPSWQLCSQLFLLLSPWLPHKLAHLQKTSRRCRRLNFNVCIKPP